MGRVRRVPKDTVYTPLKLTIPTNFPPRRENRHNLMRLFQAMPLKLGESYVCQNPLCKCEIQVTRPSTATARNPICGCGSPMKKPYRSPEFQPLPDQPSEFDFVAKKKRGA